MTINTYNASLLSIAQLPLFGSLRFAYSDMGQIIRDKVSKTSPSEKRQFTIQIKVPEDAEPLAIQEEFDQWDALSDEALNAVEDSID